MAVAFRLSVCYSQTFQMATNLKSQAIVDFEEATAENGVESGSKLMNLMLYSPAQVEALCRIGKEVQSLFKRHKNVKFYALQCMLGG